MGAETNIRLAERLSGESVKLAGWVCLAARVEPALLRRARLRFMPAAGVEVESDLWFGPLVETRGTYAATFYPDVTEELRRRLASESGAARAGTGGDKLNRAWALVREVHDHKPPAPGKVISDLIQLEEELVWHALTSSGEELEREIDARLRPVIKSIVSERHDGLGRWALGVLPRLPKGAQTRTVRLLQIISEARLYEGWFSTDPTAGEQLSEDETNMLLKVLERRPAGLRLQGDRLELSAPPREGSQKIDVPVTSPLSLELTWPTASGEHSETVEWGAEPNIYLTGVGTPLSVTTKTGENYRVVPEEEVVAPLEERVKTCLVSIDDPLGATVGSGVLVSESLILTTEDVLAAARSDEPTDGRERSAIRFPQLNVDHVIYATPAPRPRGGVQVDDGLVVLNLESWTNEGYSAAVFAPAAESVGARCLAFAFPLSRTEAAWIGLEVHEALEDGTYGLRLTTQVGAAALRAWSGSPVIDATKNALIGVLRLRPDPEDEEGLLPSLIPEPLIRPYVSAHTMRSATPLLLPVYVSSTWLDLEPERKAVEQAIQRLRETKFVGIEYFGSRDETTRRAALDDVDRGSVYLCIVGSRYGSGITEAEYDRARKNGIPCFVYFKNPEAVPGELREVDPSQFSKLEAFKEELRRTQAVNEFNSPNDLAAKVTADLHRWLFDEYLTPKLRGALSGQVSREEAQALLGAVRDLSALGRDLVTRLQGAGFIVAVRGDFVGRDTVTHIYNAPTPAIPTLHQLRAPVGDFVGREKEIAELMAALRGGASAAVTGISGMGGIGKTELAFYVAERLRDAYPDGQLILDMRGTDDPPRDTADALAACIRAFVGVEQRLPEETAELTRIYRAILEGKRALILLDNAHTGAQVRPLLPPAGSALLVTSRNAITLPGMRTRVTLEQLSPTEARELLTGIAPRVPEETADRICYLCGYLPLAIRAAGSLLDVTADLAPDTYAEQLSDERTRLTLIGTEGVDVGVEASFGLSYARLTPDAARVFRQIAVFPASFDHRAEETVCEDPEHKHLSELLRRNLIRYNGETRRYSLNDLVRLFADSHMSDDERHATRMRHAAHYLTVLDECDAFYKKGGDAIKSGLSLFDVERRNIEAGQEWASQHSTGDEAAARLCNQYPVAGVYVLRLRQHPREFISWLEAALAAARQLKDRASEEMHSGNLGNVYADLGEYRRAIEFSEQAVAIAREIGDRIGEGHALGNLGFAYADLGETRRAVEFYEQALIIAREIGDRRGEGIVLFNTALTLDELGDRAKAIAHAEAALEIYEQIESPYAERVRAKLAQWRGQ